MESQHVLLHKILDITVIMSLGMHYQLLLQLTPLPCGLNKHISNHGLSESRYCSGCDSAIL